MARRETEGPVNKAERPETDLHMYKKNWHVTALVFTKLFKNEDKGVTATGTTDYPHRQIKLIDPYTMSMTKQYRPDFKTICRSTIVQFLAKNIGKYLYDLKVGKDFLNKIQIHAIKEKNDTHVMLKCTTSIPKNRTINKDNGQSKTEINFL